MPKSPPKKIRMPLPGMADGMHDPTARLGESQRGSKSQRKYKDAASPEGKSTKKETSSPEPANKGAHTLSLPGRYRSVSPPRDT